MDELYHEVHFLGRLLFFSLLFFLLLLLLLLLGSSTKQILAKNGFIGLLARIEHPSILDINIIAILTSILLELFYLSTLDNVSPLDQTVDDELSLLILKTFGNEYTHFDLLVLDETHQSHFDSQKLDIRIVAELIGYQITEIMDLGDLGSAFGSQLLIAVENGEQLINMVLCHLIELSWCFDIDQLVFQ